MEIIDKSEIGKDGYLTGKNSPSAKLSRGEITDKEYRSELAKRRGFESIEEYNDFNIKRKSSDEYDDIISKEDLERYYITEKKSMAEISRICKCNETTIRRRLIKYEISIRLHGSTLVGDDRTLSSKRNRGEISESEYRNELAKSQGYENRTDYLKELAKEKGFENWRDYLSDLARKKGFEDVNEYDRERHYKKGKCLPMSENKECSAYLGIYICENKEFLRKIINIVENMPNNNPGYDIICGKGKKIDVKCSCLSNKKWSFAIDKNKIADYFLCISFDNRENLNVEHIWLMKGDVVIEKTNNHNSKEFIVNERDAIDIGNGHVALQRWIKHEITNVYKLNEVQKVCDVFKKEREKYEIDNN